LIPAEEARGGAEKGEVFASGAEFFVGLRKRGHGVMMKQQKDLWNVFLAGRVEFFSNRIVPARSPFQKQEALILAKAEFREQFIKR
jgi:hypothetical protein